MRNPYTKAMTKRFVEAMNTIIHQNVLRGGDFTDKSKFAKTIKVRPQNMNKWLNGSQDVGSVFIEAICRSHRVNPAWIILGEGEMFLQSKSMDDITALAMQLRGIASKLEKQEKPRRLRRV